MPKVITRIEDFEIGITNDITKPGFAEMEGFDVFDEPGILKVNKQLENLSSTLNDTPRDMVKYGSGFFLLTDTSIYLVKAVSGSIYKLHDVNNRGVDIKVFKDNMYWSGSNTGVGKTIENQLNGAINDTVTTITVDSTTGFPTSGDLLIGDESITYTGTTATTFTGCTRGQNGTTATSHSNNATVLGFIDDFQTFTSSFSQGNTGKNLKVFNNRLYACNGNTVDEWDNIIWTNDVFTMPDADIVTSIEELETQLCFGTSVTSSTGVVSVGGGNLYFWDGVSANATNIIRTPLQGITALKEWENTLFAFAGKEGEIHRFNGADLLKIAQIPNWTADDIITQNAVKVFKNGLIFGTGQGIYQLNRLTSNEGFTLNKYGRLSTDQGDEQIKFIYIIDFDDFYVGFEDGGNNYLDKTDTTYYQKTKTTLETNLINLTNKRLQPQRVTGLMAEWFTNRTKAEIDVYYKTDKDIETGAGYTSLGTIDPSSTDRLQYMLTGIGKRTKYVQFKFNIGSTSDLAISPKIKSLNII